MAFDNHLADRIRQIFALQQVEITEKKMFGGLCFLYRGKMTVGIVKELLMVRIADPNFEKALQEPHVLPMDFTGKPMRHFVYVEPEGFATEQELRRWLQFGIEHALQQLGA